MKCSPAEMVDMYLGKGMEAEALKVSEEHQLDTDRVYSSLWSSKAVTEDNIASYLDRVQDRRWVVEQCVERIAVNHPDERVLLQHGLKETAKQCQDLDRSMNLNGEQDDELRWYLKNHLKMLGCMDRLETFTQIHKGGYSQDAFSSFRETNLISVALAYASTGNTQALQVLLERHPHTLYKNMLTVLSQLPETLDAHTWINLLPKPGTCPSQLYAGDREQDPLETEATLERLGQADVCEGLELTEFLVSLRHNDTCPYSMEMISDWCVERAHTMDLATGQLSYSKAFLELAVKEGIQGSILNALQDVGVLSSVLKENAQIWNMQLKDFSEMTLPDRLDLVLMASSDTTMEVDITEKLVGMLEGLDRAPRRSVLSNFLTKEFARRPSWVVKLAETEQAEGVLFGGDHDGTADYCSMILSVVRSVSQVNDWEDLSALMLLADTSIGRLIELGSKSDATCEQSQGSETQEHSEEVNGHTSLIADITKMVRTVEAGRILSCYGVQIPFQNLQNADDDFSLTMVRLMLSRASRGGKSWSDSKWRRLWGDLRALSKSLADPLNEQTLLTEYCRALLRAGQSSVAEGHLSGESEPAMEPGAAEVLVMSVGREFLYSAPSLTDDAIEDAKKCFELLPEVEAAQAELQTVEALQQLPNFGFTLLPMQLKQLPNRMDVIAYLLKAQSGNYKNLGALRSIAELLGLKRHEDHLEVDLMIGQAAVDAQDFEVAGEVASGLAKGGFKKAWQLCAAVAQSGGESIRDTQKNSLNAFAVAHCPEGDLKNMVDRLIASNREASEGPALPQAPEDRVQMALATTPSAVPLNMEALSMGDSSLSLHLLLSNPNLMPLNGKSSSSFMHVQRANAMTILSKSIGNLMKDKVLEDLIPLPVDHLLSAAESGGAAFEGLEDAKAAAASLQAARFARSMKSIMPGVDVMRFASGDFEYRKQLILEEAAHAGEVLAMPNVPKATSHTAMRQATQLAQEYGVEPAAVATAFIVSTIVSAPEITPAVKSMLAQHEATALEAPRAFVSKLWETAWGEISGSDSERLYYLLYLVNSGLASEGNTSGIVLSIGELVERSSCQVASLDMKAVMEESVMGAMGLETAPIVGNKALLEVFRCVTYENAYILAGILDEVSNITGTPHAISTSTVYTCMVVKQVDALVEANSTGALCSTSSLESSDFWESSFHKMNGLDMLKILLWCCLSGPEPLEIEGQTSKPPEVSSNVKIACLTVGIPLLQQDAAVAASDTKTLDQELRRLCAMDKAQELAGMSSSEFHALLQNDEGSPLEETLDNAIRQLLYSGSKVDVVLEVVGSVAKTRDGGSEPTVPDQVLDFLLQEIKAAVQSSVDSFSSAYDTIQAVVKCLSVSLSTAADPVVCFLQLARDSVWTVLSNHCLAIEGENLDMDGVIPFFKLCESLGKGLVWEQWSHLESPAISTARSKILFLETRSMIGDATNAVYVWSDFESRDSCQNLFSQILPSFSGQLSILADLLRSVWNHGLMLLGPEDVGGGVGVVPLHECWSQLFLSMIEQKSVAHVIAAVDTIREEVWVPSSDTDIEPCTALSLLTLSETEELVVALDNPNHAICVGLMVPYEEIRKSAVKQIASNGCNGVILGLLLEGGFLSVALDQPDVDQYLYQPLLHAPLHPALLDFWVQCQEARANQILSLQQDPGMDVPGVHIGSEDLGGGGDAGEGSGAVGASGNTWEDAWDDSNDREEDSGVEFSQPGASNVRDAPHHQSSQPVLNDDEMMDDSGGWGDGDDENDWEETLREAQQLANASQNQPPHVSPPRAEVSCDADMSDGDGWRNSDGDDDWDATLREAARMAGGSRAEDQSRDAGPSGSAQPERVALEGLEPGMGDPGSGMEEGWGDDCEWSETLRAAEQMAGDPPLHEPQGIPGDGGNPPGVDAASVDGWDDDDDELGELLRARGEPTDALATSSAVPVDPSGSAVEGHTDVRNDGDGRPAGDSDNPPCAASQREDGGTLDSWKHGHVESKQSDVQVDTNRDAGPSASRDEYFEEDWEGSVLLYSCLLPQMVSSLCKLKRFGLAASIVCERLRLHSDMITPESGAAFLAKYLRSAAGATIDFSAHEDTLKKSRLPCTSRRLLERLPKDCMEALAQVQVLSGDEPRGTS